MRTLAFYLPQFHAIPENDHWWGTGFTEWTNASRAQPQFDGHQQPRVPGELGEYSLLEPCTLRAQSELAKLAGVYGFCMYFYWFDGKRLLEKPVDMWSEDTALLPYCLSWANEPWTRRWDGKDKEVLMPQTYSQGFEEGLFESLLPHFVRPHYIRQHGLPILVIHRPNLIPDARRFSSSIRRLAQEAGLPGLHLIGAETQPPMTPDEFGLDALVEFPPVGQNTLSTAMLQPLSGINPNFSGRLMSYEKLAKWYAERDEPGFVRYRCVAPSWDNTARRMERATVYHGSTPELYRHWLVRATRAERATRGEDGLAFINAWNEWAEGAYLEPDSRYGRSYLHATRDAHIQEAVADRHGPVRFWSYPQIKSLTFCAGGPMLRMARRLSALRRRITETASSRSDDGSALPGSNGAGRRSPGNHAGFTK